jgi:hypothetical protein
MQLNGWQRIGVVVSVAWIIGAGLYQRNADVHRAQAAMTLSYKACTEALRYSANQDFGKCMDGASKDFGIWMDGSWANVASTALIPVPLGWALAYAMIAVWRWIAAGFRRKAAANEPTAGNGSPPP